MALIQPQNDQSSWKNFKFLKSNVMQAFCESVSRVQMLDMFSTALQENIIRPSRITQADFHSYVMILRQEFVTRDNMHWPARAALEALQ